MECIIAKGIIERDMVCFNKVLSRTQRAHQPKAPGTLLMRAMRGTAEGSSSTTCFAAIIFHAEAPHHTITRATSGHIRTIIAGRAFFEGDTMVVPGVAFRGDIIFSSSGGGSDSGGGRGSGSDDILHIV